VGGYAASGTAGASVELSVTVLDVVCISVYAVHVHRVAYVEFVYEGHRVKVKVTGAEKVENSYSRNVKLRLAITPVMKHRAVMFACSMGFSGTADRMV